MLTKYLSENHKKLLQVVGAKVRDQFAEDILSEAYVRALKYYNGQDNVEAWFYRVLNNCIIDYYNGNMKKKDVFVDGVRIENKSNGESAEDILIREEILDNILNKIVGLKNRTHREVLIAVLLDGHSYEDAADIGGCTVDAVKGVVKRFRKEVS